MKISTVKKISLLLLIAIALPTNANALTVDWSGYFRADNNHVRNFTFEGKKSTTFSSVFFKLKPKVLVNDNVIIKSEWNIGDPIYGFFGRSIPREDRNNPLSTGKDSFPISAARIWMDVHTDFGTLQVGRAPFHWGLGAIFNSGDHAFDRFQSTSDTIRLVSKFGYLSLMPIYAKNSMGRSLGGARNPSTNAIVDGADDITDYGIGLSYDNPEEDLQAGGLYYKRNAQDQQNSYYFPAGQSTYNAGANGMNLKLFNFFAKKTWNRFEIGAEVPIYRGEIGDINQAGTRNIYSATAIALETALKFDSWKHSLKLGTVPGQGPTVTGNRGRNFSAMEFHRAYKLGLILFNYNLGYFGANNPDSVPGSANSGDTVVSAYDASISNAKYVMFSTEKRWEQWGMNLGVVWAQANQSAQTGKDAFNHRARRWFTATSTQGESMGFEVDFGTRYSWDDSISFGADFGMLFPGDYLKFVDSVTNQGVNKKVFAATFSAATVF
jgi:hypothetical protein